MGYDDGKEFKRSSRKKFGGAQKDIGYLNIKKPVTKNKVIEDEIEEEMSSDGEGD